MTPVVASRVGCHRSTVPRELRVIEVTLLHEGGLSGLAIARKLGLSSSYVYSLLNDPTDEGGRARKRANSGVCVDCGGPTSGGDGRANAPDRCSACDVALRKAERKWTPESVVDAIRRFAEIHGRAPLATEWARADPVNGYPATSTVYSDQSAPFASWADAVEAAGFPRPERGKFVRSEETLAKLRRPRGPYLHMRRFDYAEARRLHEEGLTIAAIARRLGVTDNSVGRVIRRGLV